MSDPTRAKPFTQFRSLFCSTVFDPDLILGQILSIKWIAEVVTQEVGETCDRIFEPLVTLALFLGQVFRHSSLISTRLRGGYQPEALARVLS